VTRITFTHSIARSAKRRCLSYSEADFDVFRPAGATRCTDGGKIWRGGVYRMRGRCGNGPRHHSRQ